VCLIISSFYPKGLALGKQQGILIVVFLFLWTACQLSFTVAWSAVYTKYKNTSLHAYMYQFFLLIGMLVLNLAVFFYCGCTNGFVFIATCCVVSCHSFISSTYLLLCLVRKWRRIGYYILDVVS